MSGLKYNAVNSQWPENLPALDGPEAIAAAKRLYRFGMGRTWKGKWKITSGNRITWPRNGIFAVNPHRENWSEASAGWPDLVHMISHYCHQRLHPTKSAHDGRHHFLEKEMVAHVIAKGWLDGRLKPKPKLLLLPAGETELLQAGETWRHKPDRLPEIEASIKRWTTKSKRAATALKKLNRQRKSLLTRRAARGKAAA